MSKLALIMMTKTDWRRCINITYYTEKDLENLKPSMKVQYSQTKPKGICIGVKLSF